MAMRDRVGVSKRNTNPLFDGTLQQNSDKIGPCRCDSRRCCNRQCYLPNSLAQQIDSRLASSEGTGVTLRRATVIHSTRLSPLDGARIAVVTRSESPPRGGGSDRTRATAGWSCEPPFHVTRGHIPRENPGMPSSSQASPQSSTTRLAASNRRR